MFKVWLQGSIGLVLLAVLCFTSFTGGIGASSEGGGFTTFIKVDFIAGNTTDSRVGGGQQPAGSFGDNTTVYCGRLGILSPIKCLYSTPVTPTGGTGDSSCPDDFRIVSNKVGLRRLNWLKRGIALNAGLPDGESE